MPDVIPLESLEIYTLSNTIAESIWETVSKWNWFTKQTISIQVVKAADSIGANIAEGYGRYFYKDRKQFCYYSRGSLLETKTWLTKAFQRKLISEPLFNDLINHLKNATS